MDHIMMRKAVFLLLLAVFLGGGAHAQPPFVRETNTPIALHYAKILNDYMIFIEPRLGAKEDLVKISREYFDRLGYRLILVTVHSTVKPKVSKSWKIPGSKLAVLPRMTCYTGAAGPTVELHDQGDDYVRIQNFADGTASGPGVYVAVGITHRWE